MHYYKFNISAWNLSTSHLSLIEESIYFRLINHYYDTESPIPEETQMVIRRLRFANHSDIVEQILMEFFVLTDKGWIHKRCDAEIKIYRTKSKINKSNGAKGGRPNKHAAQRVTQNKPKRLTNANQTDSENNPNYKLLTTNYKLITNNNSNSSETVKKSKKKSSKPAVPYEEIKELYNNILPELIGARLLDPKRKLKLNESWNFHDGHQSLDFWEKYFNAVRSDDFIMGRTQKSPPYEDWKASFEYVVQIKTIIKITER